MNNKSMSSPEPHIPTVEELLQCLRLKNADVQQNAAAFLQHATYKNENNKEIIRCHNGIPILISLLNSGNNLCQFYAACVLRNLSNSPNQEIQEQIASSGIFEILEDMIVQIHQYERRLTEAIVAIICNLSCSSMFRLILSNSILSKIVHCIFMPLIGIRIDFTTNRVHQFTISELSISYCPLLEYITAFLKNMSGGPSVIRQQMRFCGGLVDSLTAIIQHGFDNDNFNCTIVENCISTIRNMCFSLHEIQQNNNYPMNQNDKVKGPESKNGQSSKSHNNNNFNNPRESDQGTVTPLLNSEIIDLLLEIINNCKNHVSIEAAIGTIQNLAACKLEMAEQFRVNFRRKKGLPHLILQVVNGPDKIAQVAIIALKNLAENNRNLELIGDHGLAHLLQCLPSSGCSLIKRIIVSDAEDKSLDMPEEFLSLDTIYSALYFIYYLLQKRVGLCEVFVKKNGVKNCMYLLKSDIFYRENFQNSNPMKVTHADQLPILAAAILRLLWDKPKLRSYFQSEKLSCEDFCVQGFSRRLKSSISCSSEGEPSVYYGEPYIKARTNKLLPLNYKITKTEFENLYQTSGPI